MKFLEENMRKIFVILSYAEIFRYDTKNMTHKNIDKLDTIII